MATRARTQFPNPKIGNGSVLVPSSCPSGGDVEARLAWCDAKLFPAWKRWRVGNPGEIVVSRLLRGGYHQ